MSGGVLIWKQIHDRGLAKFEKGQAEHGGDLRRKPVLHEILNEMLDGACYALVLEQQLGMALLNLKSIDRIQLPPAAADSILRAIHLLEFGNAEGESL